MKVSTTTIEQTANELLGKKATTLYYLILEVEGTEKFVINVGEKTHNKVKELIKIGNNEDTNKQMNETIVKELKKGGK